MTTKFTKGPWVYDAEISVIFGDYEKPEAILICDMMPTGEAADALADGELVGEA
jgi:hypothetical protein